MAEEVAGPKQGTCFCYFAKQMSSNCLLSSLNIYFYARGLIHAAFSPGQRGFFCNGKQLKQRPTASTV